MRFIDRLVKHIMKNNYESFTYQFKASPYFLFFKKHYCIDCKSILKRKLKGKNIRKTDNDYNKNDFYIHDTTLFGDVYCAHTVFKCEQCGREYEPEELEGLELLGKNRKIENQDVISIKQDKKRGLIIFIILIVLLSIVIPMLDIYFNLW